MGRISGHFAQGTLARRLPPARTCTSRARSFIVSSPDSCAREVTLRGVMAEVESPSTAVSLRMKVSLAKQANTLERGVCLWPTQGRIPTDLSSLSALETHHIWMVNTWYLDR